MLNGAEADGPDARSGGVFSNIWAFKTSAEGKKDQQHYLSLEHFLYSCGDRTVQPTVGHGGKHPSALMPYFPQTCTSKKKPLKEKSVCVGWWQERKKTCLWNVLQDFLASLEFNFFNICNVCPNLVIAAYPACCFLLGPPEEAEEFPGLRFGKRDRALPSQRIRLVRWSFQEERTAPRRPLLRRQT